MSELYEAYRKWPSSALPLKDGRVDNEALRHAPAKSKSRIGRRQERIARRDGWKCHYCDHRLSRNDPRYRAPTIDHVLPVARGGTNRMKNLVLACPTCNHRKDDQTPTEWLGKPCCKRHGD